MDELEQFRAKLENDEQARAKFAADIHKALQNQGIAVHDPQVMKKFGFAAHDIKDFKNLTAASSAIITIIN